MTRRVVRGAAPELPGAMPETPAANLMAAALEFERADRNLTATRALVETTRDGGTPILEIAAEQRWSGAIDVLMHAAVEFGRSYGTTQTVPLGAER